MKWRMMIQRQPLQSRLILAVTLTTTSLYCRDPSPTQVLKKLDVFLLGNAGLRSHFPAQFEPMEDRGERQIEEEEEEGRGEEDDRMAEGPEVQAGVSVEAQIGRKLRQIGDKFQQDHIELVSRQWLLK